MLLAKMVGTLWMVHRYCHHKSSHHILSQGCSSNTSYHSIFYILLVCLTRPVYSNQQMEDSFESRLVFNEYIHATKKMAEEDAVGVALQSFVKQHPDATDVRDLLHYVARERKRAGIAVLLACMVGNPWFYYCRSTPTPSPPCDIVTCSAALRHSFPSL